MKSGYKRLGDYIRLVDERNRNLEVTTLRGLSMRKEFRKSTSNVVGTDMSNYKIVRKNRFACDFMSVIRVFKLPVVLQTVDEAILVSPAYSVFEVIDKEILIPEYLMLWFRRSEFDRYCFFKCDSAVRGGFNWAELCDTELPIPSIEKQKEIIEEYEVIENRIQLNKKLCATLEETAQTIYKHWFEDFEFAVQSKSDPELVEGYKSSGGEMMWCEELRKEIPIGWRVGNISDLVTTQYGYTASANFIKGDAKLLRITDIVAKMIKWNDVPYCDISDKEFSKYKIIKGDILLSRTGANVGYAKLISCETTNSVFASFLVRLKVINPSFQNLVSLKVISEDYKRFVLSIAEGSAQPQANANILTKMEIVISDEITGKKFNKFTNPILDKIEKLSQEIEKLEELKSLLLGKMAVERSNENN